MNRTASSTLPVINAIEWKQYLVPLISTLIIVGLLTACGSAASPEPQLLPTSTQSPPPLPTEKSAVEQANSPVITPISPLASPISPTTTPSVEQEPASLPGTEALIAQAKMMLTQLPKLDISPDDIALVAVEAKQWRDSSLGCPRPGMRYNQVITPGYLIALKAKGNVYEFHTNTRNTVVLCLINGEDAFRVLSQ
jgi:hypothetical protein